MKSGNAELNLRGTSRPWPVFRKSWFLGMVILAALAGVMLQKPLAQDPAYHHFADQRTFLGLSRALDSLSNVSFLIAGAAGLAALTLKRFRAGAVFADPRERVPYLVFFGGMALIALGSFYYHLQPDNQRLLWDRLPMAVAFMALLSAVISERLGISAGLKSLVPLLLLGTGSVLYWYVTETMGLGDLRPYGLVQFLPMILIPLLLILYRSRYSGAGYLCLALAIYALAKLFELWDREVLEYTALVSGHTVKHLLAAFGAGIILFMLRARRIIR